MKNLLSVVINCENDNYHSNFINRLENSLIKLENMYGHSLSRSSKNKNQRQLSDGIIGRWKEMLNDDHLEYIKMRFNEFDIKLSDFI